VNATTIPLSQRGGIRRFFVSPDVTAFTESFLGQPGREPVYWLTGNPHTITGASSPGRWRCGVPADGFITNRADAAFVAGLAYGFHALSIWARPSPDGVVVLDAARASRAAWLSGRRRPAGWCCLARLPAAVARQQLSDAFGAVLIVLAPVNCSTRSLARRAPIVAWDVASLPLAPIC
jgi:hypothetical protein